MLKQIVFRSLLLVLLLLLLPSFYTTATWDVKWYSINEDTYDFEELLGEESWPNGGFFHDWDYSVVFSSRKDYVGFVASTPIYSNGDSYKFSLFDVNDEATVYIDNREILSYNEIFDMLNKKSIRVEIQSGYHELKVVYIEDCCQASVGFSADDTLFNISIEVFAEPHSGGYVEIEPLKTTFTFNEKVTLTAKPFDNYKFDYWSGDFEGTKNIANITMDSDKEITAHFFGNNPPSIAITSHVIYLPTKIII